MGCIPGTIAGVVRGSVLLFVGIISDSQDARNLGKKIILGEGVAEEQKSLYDEIAEYESMRVELVQWRRDLLRCKKEGSTASAAKLQQQLEMREAELRDLEEKHLRLEEETRNYPLPTYLASADYDSTTNIAIAGCCGVGKSLLVNSIRQVKPGDQTHAPVGIKHTTATPTVYDLSGNESVRLWDLPGAGSKHYPRETYPRAVGLRHFDVVLLATGCRFTQTDADLFRGLCEQGVPTLVVRTMVDLDVSNGKADLDQPESETKQRILSDLKNKGVFNPYLVNARKRDDHDFQTMMGDLHKALARARGLPRRVSVRSNEKDFREPELEVFEAGDAAEVAVLKGPFAGSWARCTITGSGTFPDCYSISLPDAPKEKRDIPNVHVSALRGSPGQQEPPPLDLDTVKKVLSAFKEACGRQDVRTTLVAIDNQGTESPGIRKIKRDFIAQTLGQAMSGMGPMVPREASPRFLERLRQHEADAEVRALAREVEALLDLAGGELLGMPPPEEEAAPGTWGSVLSAGAASIREAHLLARRRGGSRQVLLLLLGCGFLDLLSLASLPGPFAQPVLLVFRTYSHFQCSRAGAAGALDKAKVPLTCALGSAAACLVVCLLAQRYGQDLISQLPASATGPSHTARSAIEACGSLGVAACVLLAGPGSALPSIMHASALGCRASTLTLATFAAGVLRVLIELEVVLALRAWLLCFVPFAQDAAAAPGAMAERARLLFQMLVAGKAAAQGFVRARAALVLKVMFGLTLLGTICTRNGYLLRALAAPLRYALYYLRAVEDAPTELSSMLSVPAADGAATAVGAAVLQVAARWQGEQAVASSVAEPGWELALAAVRSCGSLGLGLGALLGASSAADAPLAAAAASEGCNVLLAAAALFVAVTLRSALFLEGNVVAVRGLQELPASSERREA